MPMAKFFSLNTNPVLISRMKMEPGRFSLKAAFKKLVCKSLRSTLGGCLTFSLWDISKPDTEQFIV